MPTSVECICCHELPQVHDLIDDASAVCITQHPGFNSVCLNIWVLQSAYYICCVYSASTSTRKFFLIVPGMVNNGLNLRVAWQQ